MRYAYGGSMHQKRRGFGERATRRHRWKGAGPGDGAPVRPGTVLHPGGAEGDGSCRNDGKGLFGKKRWVLRGSFGGYAAAFDGYSKRVGEKYKGTGVCGVGINQRGGTPDGLWENPAQSGRNAG